MATRIFDSDGCRCYNNQHHPQRVRMMIRILFVIDTHLGGHTGSERHLLSLVEGLPAESFRIWVVQLSSSPTFSLPFAPGTLPGHPNVTLLHMPTGRVYGFNGVKTGLALMRLVRRERIDVVQSLLESSDVLCAVLPDPFERSTARISSRRDMGIFKSDRLTLASRLLNRRFDRVVAPSQAVLDIVARTESLRPTSARVIPNGVDIVKFAPVRDKGARRSTLPGIARESLWLVCVASLRPVKGHVHLIRALSLARSKGHDLSLLLIGEGAERTNIERTARAHGVLSHTHFLGKRDDVDAILPLCDIKVLPSLSEGLSNALLEAMACGLPVICTRVGGNPETVSDGVDGLLVPPSDDEALALAIEALAENGPRRLEMARMARAAIEARYSLDAMVNAFSSLYTAAAASR